jgi:3-deoxy-D-manno-octulosonic-acid transferase
MLYLVILLASPFSKRARQWISGRRTVKTPDADNNPGGQRRTLWMHVSSLGEFEQGRPLLEHWRERFPGDRILLSFFSPSGYTIRKDYPLADHVFYLPLDTRKKMDRLVGQIQPDLFILVKYDFWPNLLQALHRHRIDTCLVSATFRPDQYLFQPWGKFFLDQIRNFKWIFVQDEESASLLKSHRFDQVTVAGDTRVDAVMTRRSRPVAHGSHPVLIGGSTWPPEEKMIATLWLSDGFKELKTEWRLVIAPHDISEKHLVQIEELFGGNIIRHSRLKEPLLAALDHTEPILIDSIGLLSSLYASADLAFIGGGFGKGIHNILEPAAFGLPILFGPKWTKFREAVTLADIGAAFPVNDFEMFRSRVINLCSDSKFRAESGNLALSYMKSQMGSSDLIIRDLLGKT